MQFPQLVKLEAKISLMQRRQASEALEKMFIVARRGQIELSPSLPFFSRQQEILLTRCGKEDTKLQIVCL
ncbi:MAG TPA: hypothetical protein DDW93_05705 [Firmicutes bacterium]|jgi:hypothetical protein|nr:hypothetical protein [Bacillota bacterium]HBT18056.1 hypothetical protein [Bacillota bacterium]